VPGKSYIERINLNGRILFTVTSSPNGVLPGNAGDMAFRTDAPNGTVYVNVDGALVWVDLSTLSAPSPWSRVGTAVQLIIGTDEVGIGTPFPATKLHVDSLAAPTVPVLTLANLASDWKDFVGSGSPEGVVTASRGDTFHDDLGNLWLKVVGDATNTGWLSILTSAVGWVQDGNAFGALGTLGTLDPFDLRFITNGLEAARLTTIGQKWLVGAVVPFGTEKVRVVGDVRFEGKLTVTGEIDPTALLLSDPAAGTSLFVDSADGATAPVAPAGHGRLRYAAGGLQRWEASVNTGAYQPLLTPLTGWVQDGNTFGALGTLGTLDPFDLRFITNGLERARVLSATGQVLINAVAPAADERLRVNGDGRFDGNLIVTQDLVVQGTTVSVDSETVLIADNHLYLNNGYETPAPQTGGLVVNYLPIAVTDTVGAGGFTAGVLAVSNPTVITTGAGTFAIGELIQISGTGTPVFPINDGLFEVLSHIGTTLTIRGVGLVGTVEDFTQNQFATDPLTAGSITRVSVSISRAGLDGKWEVGQGSVTPIVFTDLATVTDSGWTDDGTVVRLTTATDQVGVGTAAPAVGVKVHVVEDGAARGIRSDVGVAADLALQSRLVGDLFPRFDINGLGYLFGGSGAAGVDVLLRRATVGVAAWEARDSADAVFINVRGADAVIDDDLVTRRQLTAQGGTPLLLWGNSSVAASTTTRYLTPGYSDNIAQTTETRFIVESSGVLKRLAVRHNGTAGNGNPIVYTVLVNGVATAITVSLASTGTSATDLVNTAAVVPDDEISLRATKAATIATSPSNISVTLEYRAA